MLDTFQQIFTCSQFLAGSQLDLSSFSATSLLILSTFLAGSHLAFSQLILCKIL